MVPARLSAHTLAQHSGGLVDPAAPALSWENSAFWLVIGVVGVDAPEIKKCAAGSGAIAESPIHSIEHGQIGSLSNVFGTDLLNSAYPALGSGRIKDQRMWTAESSDDETCSGKVTSRSMNFGGFSVLGNPGPRSHVDEVTTR